MPLAPASEAISTSTLKRAAGVSASTRNNPHDLTPNGAASIRLLDAHALPGALPS